MSKWLYVKNHYFQRAEFLSIYSDAWPLSRSWSTVNSTPVEDVFIPMQITEEAGVWQGRLWCPRVSHLKTLVPLMVHLASHVVVERGAWQVEERCQMERKPGQIRVWTESFLVQAAVILHIRMRSGGGGGGVAGPAVGEGGAPQNYRTFSFLGWEDPRRRKWQPTRVFLPGKSHGWRSLAGYCPWGRKNWTWLSDFTSFLRPQKDLKDHLVQCLSFSDTQEGCDKFMIW